MDGIEVGFYSYVPREAAKMFIVELIKSGFSKWDPHVFCSIPGTTSSDDVLLFKTDVLMDEIINEIK